MEGFLDSTYKTTDLYYAAYLRVAGVVFVDTIRESGRVTFLFEDQGPIAMRDLRKAYFADTAKVPPMAFVQAIKTMKSLTYSDGGKDG